MKERNGLSEKEAGYLGWLASKATNERKHQEIIDNYYKAPRHCVHCNKRLPYEKRYNKFCSSSCAASFNNTNRFVSVEERIKSSLKHGGSGEQFKCKTCGSILSDDKSGFCSDECKQKFASALESLSKTNIGRRVPKGICPVCGVPITWNNNNKYCSLSCFAKAKWIATRDRIEQTGMFPANSRLNETNRRVVRKYLEEKYGHKCMICDRTTWNDKDIPLIVDHIDGNATNHKVENFRLVCPNCDALLDTFKNRENRKSERTWRKDYYTKD